jgi:hypothetical protein
MSPSAIVFHRQIIRALKAIIKAYEEYVSSEEARITPPTRRV